MSDPFAEFRFDSATATDVGRVRSVNEDSHYASDEAGIWLVADGMGGHAAGDFASQTIAGQAATVGRAVSRQDLKQRFLQRLALANSAILAHSMTLGRGAIGSTLAALLVKDGAYVCVWSGDSRVYRLREGLLQRVSKDHTEVQSLLDAGAITPEEAANWPRKNVITRAIGVTEPPEYEIREGLVADGDLFLICSDGMTEYFEDPEIESVLNEGGALDVLARRFVQGAVDRGGKDNVSVVIMQAHRKEPPEQTVEDIFPEFGGLL